MGEVMIGHDPQTFLYSLTHKPEHDFSIRLVGTKHDFFRMGIELYFAFQLRQDRERRDIIRDRIVTVEEVIQVIQSQMVNG